MRVALDRHSDSIFRLVRIKSVERHFYSQLITFIEVIKKSFSDPSLDLVSRLQNLLSHPFSYKKIKEISIERFKY